MDNTYTHNAILLELQYLPCIQYFTKITSYNEVYIEQHEHYTKGSYRNRTHIASANGLLALSIPLLKGKNQRQSIKEVGISYTQPWNVQHWQSIQSAYGKSPFFEYYKDDLQPIFFKKWNYLFEFNWTLLQTVIDLLGIDATLILTSSYQKNSPADTLDFRNGIHPKPHKRKTDSNFQTQEYGQVFQEKYTFIENLSILDALFCLGPETMVMLDSCTLNRP